MATSAIENGPVAGEATVTTAGTAVPLETAANNRSVSAIAIIAKAGNTGQIYVGGSDVASTTNDGLDAGETVSFDVSSFGKGSSRAMTTNSIYIDADTSGEGVDWYGILA